MLGGRVAQGWQCQTFVAERRQSLAIPGASSPLQCAPSSCLGNHHPQGGGLSLRGPAPQNPAAWGHSALAPSGMMRTSKSLWHKQCPGPSCLQDIVISRLSIRWVNFSCHIGTLHLNPSWKSLHFAHNYSQSQFRSHSNKRNSYNMPQLFDRAWPPPAGALTLTLAGQPEKGVAVQPDCCAAILSSVRQHSSVKACFDDWIHAFLCKESFVPLAANISVCILYVIRHSFLPLIPTGKSCAQLQHFCVRLQSCRQPVFINTQAHGEIKARQEWFRVQSVPCATQSASSGRLLAFCCFSPCPPPFPAQPRRAVFSLHRRLSSFSVQLWLFQDIPGAIWGQEAQDGCR